MAGDMSLAMRTSRTLVTQARIGALTFGGSEGVMGERGRLGAKTTGRAAIGGPVVVMRVMLVLLLDPDPPPLTSSVAAAAVSTSGDVLPPVVFPTTPSPLMPPMPMPPAG